MEYIPIIDSGPSKRLNEDVDSTNNFFFFLYERNSNLNSHTRIFFENSRD